MVARDTDQTGDQFELTFALGREHRHHRVNLQPRQANCCEAALTSHLACRNALAWVLVPFEIRKFSRSYFRYLANRCRTRISNKHARPNAGTFRWPLIVSVIAFVRADVD